MAQKSTRTVKSLEDILAAFQKPAASNASPTQANTKPTSERKPGSNGRKVTFS